MRWFYEDAVVSAAAVEAAAAVEQAEAVDAAAAVDAGADVDPWAMIEAAIERAMAAITAKIAEKFILILRFSLNA